MYFSISPGKMGFGVFFFMGSQVPSFYKGIKGMASIIHRAWQVNLVAAKKRLETLRGAVTRMIWSWKLRNCWDVGMQVKDITWMSWTLKMIKSIEISDFCWGCVASWRIPRMLFWIFLASRYVSIRNPPALPINLTRLNVSKSNLQSDPCHPNWRWRTLTIATLHLG